ncbi:MAG: heme-binding protein [Alphaproteobacteria bacterium TMED89]|nr:GlcG protein [Rhodospirillaceae bacterium]RPH11193.1 MAG: heme-binding protein [Alphaproteobacteria bacterium TMED89]
MPLSLDHAQTIIAAAFKKGGDMGFKPLSVAVLDAGGHVIAFARQDGSSNLRFKIAEGKAAGAIALGMGSRAIFERAQQQPYFVGALNGLMDGSMVPVPGGVLIMEDGALIGGVGVTGDTSDNDEIAAIAGVEAAGFAANAG